MADFTGSWDLDPTHSEVGFVARHAGVSKVKGRFTEVVGHVAHGGTEVHVDATAKATSFTTGNDDRDAHVKSEDFLAVEQYPELAFQGKLEDNGTLAGELTIRGVTRKVTFDVEYSEPVEDPFGNTRVGVEATATISRKDFGLTWNVTLPGGNMLVSDKISIVLDLSFIKAA